MIYDLIIIGGGPAGVSAGVYAARKKLKTLLITPDFGGQSVVSENIENWIGTVKISGKELSENLKKHLLAYAGDCVTVVEGEFVKNIEKVGEKSEQFFKVTTDKNSYDSRAVLVATGSHRRKLEIPGAKEFDNKGLTYCASCDGPLFAGEDVVIVGGGNAALESAAQLLAYCKSVTILNRGAVLRGDEMTIEKLSENPNFKIIKNAVPSEIKGDKFVRAIVYEDALTHEKHEIKTPAVFVEIGLLPSTEFVKNILKLNLIGQIPINPKNQRVVDTEQGESAEVAGLWAAGDCTDALYHQNNIAAGDAVRALEDIYIWLKTR
jgi:alkyl hydroperoxide reductase subunit AhpF